MKPAVSALEMVYPDWPAPPAVGAAVTTRRGGVSRGAHASLNLGHHVGDAPRAVAENRRQVAAALGLPAEPRWLAQVHGTAVCNAGHPGPAEADAALARTGGAVCAVLTADCLPVFLCDREAGVVAAIHAGWRGMAGGVIEAAVAALDVAPTRLLAWLGPAIGPDAYRVGDEVRHRFLALDPGAAPAFTTAAGGWRMDLYALARRRLAAVGVVAVYGGGFCTYRDARRFYSYRRDGATGRMAALIWLRTG